MTIKWFSVILTENTAMFPRSESYYIVLMSKILFYWIVAIPMIRLHKKQVC
ncbi:hypothetical protein BPJM79_20208 [Bacillus pumilus]